MWPYPTRSLAFTELGSIPTNKENDLIRYEYQTCLRMSDALKNDMTEICEKHKINESDLIRRAVATFVENLNETPDQQSKYLFVWPNNEDIARILPAKRPHLSLFWGLFRPSP